MAWGFQYENGVFGEGRDPREHHHLYLMLQEASMPPKLQRFISSIEDEIYPFPLKARSENGAQRDPLVWRRLSF